MSKLPTLRRKAIKQGDYQLVRSILNASPVLTHYDLADYMQVCSHASKFHESENGWTTILHAFGKVESSPHPEWVRKLRPFSRKIPHESTFCIRLDTLGFSDDPVDKIKSEWAFIEAWHVETSKKFKTNTVTSFIEALLRKKDYDYCSKFILGCNKEKDIVRKYGINIDEKLLRTFFSLQRGERNMDAIRLMIQKKWPKLAIDLSLLH